MLEAIGGFSICPVGKQSTQFAMVVRVRFLLGNFYRFDDDRIDRYVRVAGSACSGNFLNCVDNVGSVGNFPKNAVSNSILRFGFIEKVIVGRVDKELARGAIGNGGSCHCDRVFEILKAVARFVYNRSLRFLLHHVGGEATTLNHEPRDYAVEDGSVVMARFGVIDEVRYGDRSCVYVEFYGDVTLGCF